MAEPQAPDLQRPAEDNDFGSARALFAELDFQRFHEETLPELIARNGHLAAEDLRGAAPIAFAVPGGPAYTYTPSADGMRVEAGEGAAAALFELEQAAFSDLVHELQTISGLVIGQKVHLRRGGHADLERWQPALRAIFSARPIWTPAAAADLVDAAGRPLDLARTFTLDDSDEALRAFLRTAGFLHVKRVFGPDEVAALGAELERVRAALEPGAGDCWWSTNGAGEQVVTRINYLDRWSGTFRETGFDERIQRLGRLERQDLRFCADRLDGPMAFVKNADVVQGLGDLQWHQDDGLGGHPIMCPLMQVGIQLDHANAANGQVRVLAGSHRYSKHPLSWEDEAGKPVVALDTEPGDVTVHFGDVFHTTPPPTAPDAGRRVLYFKFAPPRTFHTIPPGGHYNDILFKPDAAGRVATRSATWEEDDTQAHFEERTFGDPTGRDSHGHQRE